MKSKAQRLMWQLTYGSTGQRKQLRSGTTTFKDTGNFRLQESIMGIFAFPVSFLFW